MNAGGGDGVSRLDDYEIQGVIGSGKYSTVYRARKVSTGEVVALKKIMIFEIMDSNARADCINEVKILQSLNHPNIICYKESFLANNELNIVLEWAQAGDLTELIKKAQEEGRLIPEREIWKMFVQVCDAIRHMHAKRMMHRDIKPSNVFITTEGVVKLGDLGLSRFFSSKTAQAQSMVGTPYYMSPECIKGRPYDWSSDIWSLGCLLYEMRALRNPFYQEGLNYYTLGKAINNCSYPPLPEGTSENLQLLVRRMIQQDRKLRPNVDEIYQFAVQCYNESSAVPQQ
eukprot:jgi/Mesvir1/26211/Mv02394-RA.1